MGKKFITTTTMLLLALTALAQERKIQYKPYIDLRPMHFGILVGMNLQDIELDNVGPQTITLEDGTTQEKTIVCDDDRWNSGFSESHVTMRYCSGASDIVGVLPLAVARGSGATP